MSIPAIIEGLSDAQRRALVNHIPRFYYGEEDGGWALPARDPDSFAQAGRPLMDRGLIAWHPNPRDSRTILTRLGVSVRAALTSIEEGR